MSKSPVKTPDGKRTRVDDLNTSVPEKLASTDKGLVGRVARTWEKLNQVLAGMYTGVGCSGDPHTHHTYREEEKRDSREF